MHHVGVIKSYLSLVLNVVLFNEIMKSITMSSTEKKAMNRDSHMLNGSCILSHSYHTFFHTFFLVKNPLTVEYMSFSKGS